jgi:hypothetical protein
MLELPRVELPSFTPPVLPMQNDTGVPTTTSVVSVGAALVGTSIFKQLVSLFKPVLNQLWKQIQRKRGKSPLTWARAKRLRKGRKQMTLGE